MTQPIPENPGPDTGTGSGGNPPYAQYLEKFTDPAAKSVAEQVFKEWDGNTTKRFQELHSESQQKYGWADPLMENYDPEDIQAAVQIAEQLQADPQGFAQRLIEAVGGEQGLGDPGETDEGFDPDDDPYGERFSQLEQAVSSLTEMLQGKVSTDAQKEEDAELDRTLKELAEEHGEFDEDWVLAKALKNGGDLEAAVKEYAEFEQGILKRGNRPAPRPLGAGGGLPSSDIDPTKLNDKEAKDLVKRILEDANSQ